MLRSMPQGLQVEAGRKKSGWEGNPPRDWGERQAHQIARNVRACRTAMGLSAQQLSDKTAALGAPVSRTIIADLENGRRRYVATSELFVLAESLSVAPMALLMPAEGLAEEVEVLPGVHVPQNIAMQQIAGLDEDMMQRLLKQLGDIAQQTLDVETRAAAARQERSDLHAQIASTRQLTELKRDEINQLERQVALVREETALLREQAELRGLLNGG